MPGRVARRAVTALAAAVLLFSFHRNVTGRTQYTENPWGCDWFGYLRQAQLFRDRGPIAGLSTPLTDERTRYLVEMGKRTGLPFASWEGVAPHCHHYKAETDAVVLQYPPGTGYVMSFFPPGVQARSTFVAANAVILAVMLGLVLSARTFLTTALAFAGGMAALHDVSLFSLDWSVPPSSALALLAAGPAVWLSRARNSTTRLLSAAALGFLLGCTIEMRLTNALIVVGPVLMLAVRFGKQRSIAEAGVFLAFGLALTVAMLPLLVSNAYNAGQFWLTTYGPLDAAPPVLSWEVVWTGIRFYLLQREPTAVLNLIVILVLLVALGIEGRRDGAMSEATVGAVISLAATLAFVCTHEIRVLYYLAPVRMYAGAVALFGRFASENARAAQRSIGGLPIWFRSAVAGAALALMSLTIRSVSMPVSQEFRTAAAATRFEANAVVWSDLSSGYLHYFNGRQASRLPFLEVPLQDRFLAEIARDGVPQYLVVDSDRMRICKERLAGTYRLQPVDPLFGFETYRIELR